jgi:hypothetical protein
MSLPAWIAINAAFALLYWWYATLVRGRSRVAETSTMQSSKVSLAASVVATLLAACSGQDGEGHNGPAATDDGAAGNERPSVRTATLPSDPCDWIPVSEVEAVVGKLAGPPQRKDGCRYTLVMPEAVRARRQKFLDDKAKLRAQMEAMTWMDKDETWVDFDGPMANYNRDPTTYAVTLTVNVEGGMAGELGTAAARKVMQAEMGGAPNAASAPPESEGWDSLRRIPNGVAGRIGHVSISVSGQAPDVPREITRALAARVRDRIPDLPFPVANPYQILATKGEDPCSLLTRDEAEEVLGPLVVEPYRASSYYPSLVHGEGHGCAWYTAGHRVFSLVPVWSDGGTDFKLNKGMGELMAPVMPQELTVIKGPWEQAQVGIAGSLLFLKGDRLLEVHYLTSSTDMRGAVKLAAKAMQRM